MWPRLWVYGRGKDLLVSREEASLPSVNAVGTEVDEVRPTCVLWLMRLDQHVFCG